MSVKIAMLLPFAAMAVAQLRPTNPQPTNVEFSEGEIGAVPPGWNVPRFVLDAGYQVQLRRQECRERFSSCIVYLPPPVIRDVRAAELYQTFPAAPYLEKSIHFAAWLRIEAPDRGDVELRMRVDYPFGRVEFFDSANGPVRSAEWERREVLGHVGPGAFSVSIWARYHPKGLAWVSDPVFRAD